MDLRLSGWPASVGAMIAGLVIGVIAIAALVSFAQWEEWVNLILGLGVVIRVDRTGRVNDRPPPARRPIPLASCTQAHDRRRFWP
jgi:hypothetical protein